MVSSAVGRLAPAGRDVVEVAARQHARGKKTAWERIDLLLDPGSFVELDALARHRCTLFGQDRRRPHGDGVVTGHGTIEGRPVWVFSQDATVFGGSLGETHGQKIIKVMDLAVSTGQPVIGIHDGAGGRIQEGVVAQATYGEIFRRNTLASGMVPQFSLIMGSCAGGSCYSPAITDFVVMVDRVSQMFITGPEVVRAATGEEADLDMLGGARVNNTKSGNAHYLAADEEDAIGYVRTLLSFLPSNSATAPPTVPAPAHDRRPVPAGDTRAVVGSVLDGAAFVEVHGMFAPNVRTGFGRIDGHSVGVVANDPAELGGALDIGACEKAARFVRTCDAFNVPVLTFVDVPGFLPSRQQEWDGGIRRCAKLVYAYAQATVPLVTVITGKAYGEAYVVMGSKHLGGDVNLAWPAAEVGAPGVDGVTAAAERGYLDAVIHPVDTRSHVSSALRVLRAKRRASPPKKHGNNPL